MSKLISSALRNDPYEPWLEETDLDEILAIELGFSSATISGKESKSARVNIGSTREEIALFQQVQAQEEAS